MDTKRAKTTQHIRAQTVKKQLVNDNTLSSIVRGMQHAVNTTQEIVEDHYIRVFDRYFDQDGKPKLLQFTLAPGKVVQAPLIAVVPLNALVLDEMSVEMSIEITGTSQKKVGTHADDAELDRSSFTVSFAPANRTGGRTGSGTERKDSTIGIVMKFKRGDPPEGAARIMDEFCKAVVVNAPEMEEK